MKITKFAQSCVLIDTKGKRILIDPGKIGYDSSLLADYWTHIDVILVTHKHGDHICPEAIINIVENTGAEFFTTQEVAKAYPELNPEIVKEGDVLHCDTVRVEVVHAIHGYIPRLKGGNEIYENVGYIIDDGEKRAYHTSDTICFANDYKADILLIAVNNHGLVMCPYAAAQFANEIQPEISIPIHCDNPELPGDLPSVKREFEKLGLCYKEMNIYESIEV